MSPSQINLAERPFRNTRPVSRVTILLWVVGIALLGLNASRYWDYYSGTSDESLERLETVRLGITQETQKSRDLEARLAQLDLETQNLEVAFLNQMIAERAFSWSQLFDDLGQVQPRDVRLQRLTPRVTIHSGAGDAASDRVAIDIDGTARTDDAVLEFLDALFEHPSFHSPNLTRDVRRPQGVLFAMQVTYLPGAGE